MKSEKFHVKLYDRPLIKKRITFLILLVMLCRFYEFEKNLKKLNSVLHSDKRTLYISRELYAISLQR